MAVVAVHHVRQLPGGTHLGEVSRCLVDQAAVTASLESPGDCVPFLQVERDAQFRMKALEDREEIGVHDRVVGLAAGDAIQQFAGIGRRILGPRQFGHLPAGRGQRLDVTRLGDDLQRLPVRSAVEWGRFRPW